MRAIVTILLATSAATLAAGCATGGSTGDADPDDLPPTLEITSPQRGTFNNTNEVTVTGRVTDEGTVRLSVNGTTVTPAADGSFTATVAVPAGVALIETHATDASGQDVRDVRSVLAGTLGPTDGTVKSAVGARLAPAGLAKVASAMATSAKAIDFTAMGKALNPVYNNTGCLGARIDLTSVSVGNITAGLVPKIGALDTSVTIENVTVRLFAAYRVACFSGSTTITVRSTKARLRANLGVALSAGKIRTSLPSPTVTLEGFTVSVGGVPSAIVDLLRTKAREATERALANAIRTKVPGIADARLAGLIARPVTADLLGRSVTSTVTPTRLELASTGMFVGVDTTVKVEDGEGGSYLANPMPLSSTLVRNASPLGVAIADDAVNQLFGGLWASGALDSTMPIEAVGPIASLLDDDIRTLDVKMSLPPTMTPVGSALELALGDLVITGRDAAGTEVQTFSLSLKTTLVAGPGNDNRLVLTTTTPTVFAQVLHQSAAVDYPLDASDLEAIVTGVWGVIGSQADDALARMPMPNVAGIQLGAPTVQGEAGYVVLDVGTP